MVNLNHISANTHMASTKERKDSLYHDRDRNSSEAIRKVLRGQEHIATYAGSSQYSQGTSSACGLAALNCVRVVLDLERKDIKEDILLQAMMQQETMDVCLQCPIQIDTMLH